MINFLNFCQIKEDSSKVKIAGLENHNLGKRFNGECGLSYGELLKIY